jgi:hypothetical protein
MIILTIIVYKSLNPYSLHTISDLEKAVPQNCLYQCKLYQCENAVLCGYIATLKNKQKLDVSSEGPSSRVSSRGRAFARNVEFLLIF